MTTTVSQQTSQVLRVIFAKTMAFAIARMRDQSVIAHSPISKEGAANKVPF